VFEAARIAVRYVAVIVRGFLWIAGANFVTLAAALCLTIGLAVGVILIAARRR
jgi:hypothetical protein